MKPFKIYALLLSISLQTAIAADAAKDQRDGAALMAGFYDNVDAGNLDTLAEIPSITKILAGRPFNSANLRTIDSATLVPALINAFKYNNERTKSYKAAVRDLQSMVVAKSKPDLTAPPCVSGHCPHALR